VYYGITQEIINFNLGSTYSSFFS